MFDPDVTRLTELDDVSGRYLDGVSLNALRRNDPLGRIAAGWTAALCRDDAELRAIAARNVPFFRYAAVGFVDPSIDPGYERYARDLPPFGVIFYADEVQGDGVRRDLVVRGLEPYKHPETGATFPVVIRPGTFSQRSGMTAPVGQLACWATTRQGQCAGWLTSRHVAPLLGTVVDAASECTDAAIVNNGNHPTGLTKRSAIRPVPTTAGHMHFHQGKLATTVLDVSIDFDIFKNPKFPVRFSTNRAGVPGNSGALVTESPTRDPMGVYLGSFTPWTASVGTSASGCALAIYQLETMLDLEVYL